MNLRASRALVGMFAILLACSPFQAEAAIRNDYANGRFVRQLNRGFKAFYARKFVVAEAAFTRALAIIPDNTLAMAFEDAAATYIPGGLDRLHDAAQRAVAQHPRYDGYVKLGFVQLFESQSGLDDTSNAQRQFSRAYAMQPNAAAAHVGRGIAAMRARSLNAAKGEFLVALQANPTDALAGEYIGSIYQADLKEPQIALRYALTVGNAVPDYADIQFHIGSILNDLHQRSAAIDYLTHGLELDSGRVGEAGQFGLTLLAQVYIADHKMNDAKRVLAAAVHENLDAGFASTLLAKIAKGDYNH
ncbi:MAG: hypothetical protein M3Y21_04360 [Candidatus Eremiobacteraeota bacterium]|nr:hypothetical protein [Candidatus Eremiobacteraeota bacterium]